MPLQNRVTPFREIVTVPKRGNLMANRDPLVGGQVCKYPGHLRPLPAGHRIDSVIAAAVAFPRSSSSALLPGCAEVFRLEHDPKSLNQKDIPTRCVL
jgi:hypothetical protein